MPDQGIPSFITATTTTTMGSSSNKEMLHVHIDGTGGVSARSFLDALRALARSSGEKHSKDAVQMCALSTAIWTEHIPAIQKQVLQDGDGANVTRELPVKSYEPFRKAIADSPPEVSPRILEQLEGLVRELEAYYGGAGQKSGQGTNKKKKTPAMYPSTVWHMMSVVLLLDRLHVNSLSCTAVPQDACTAALLQDFPVQADKASSENPVPPITVDGAILLKVLQPTTPVSPDLDLHGSAVGHDGRVVTELGMGVVTALAKAAPPPPVAALAHDDASATSAVAAAARGAPKEEEAQAAGLLASDLWQVESNLTLLATNVDDMTAEHLAFCTEVLLTQGAADVWLTPIVMKKGRAAVQLNCLAPDALVAAFLVTIFRQTTTLGVRVWSHRQGLQRVSLRREMVTVQYQGEPIPVKLAYLGKDVVSIKPEYSQCARVAHLRQMPVQEVADETKMLAKEAMRRKVLSMV
jgi:hypothetical protein